MGHQPDRRYERQLVQQKKPSIADFFASERTSTTASGRPGSDSKSNIHQHKKARMHARCPKAHLGHLGDPDNVDVLLDRAVLQPIPEYRTNEFCSRPHSSMRVFGVVENNAADPMDVDDEPISATASRALIPNDARTPYVGMARGNTILGRSSKGNKGKAVASRSPGK
jgi:hypothetical protein